MISWADLLLGPVFTKIINTLFDYLEEQLRWQAGMKEELQRLRNNHPKIQAVVSAANQADIIDTNPALKQWIWKLRDAIDEADDLLDDFEYMRHAEQLVSNTEEETNVRPFKSFIDNFSRFGQRALQIDPLLNRLVEVVKKLDKVSADVNTFLNLIDRAQLEEQKQLDKLHENRETGSLPTNVLIGRSDDKEFVLQWLLEQEKPSNDEHQPSVLTTTLYPNISLLSIVGAGGMGKTTLLQHVYKDIMSEFELKMWVCVSNNFDVKKVIAGMLESLKKREKDLDTLEAFQSKLEYEVKSKKFLLVLDDIWEENETIDKSKWEKVMAPLAGGSLGSKILITTRMDSVASMIAKVIKTKKEVRRLKALKEGECLNLLNTHAFAGVENSDDHKKLRYIAEELGKKLSGSPLAAKVMGGVLNSDLDEKHWRKVLNSNLGQNDIFPILKLSYIFLPKHLQNCFTFCSIFPQDYEFDKDDLVRMWIAVGFIQPSDFQEETLEDIGEQYFEVLVKKSFFDEDTQCYKMHDLLHELAQIVSNQECFRDAGDEKLLLKAPETIRHLSIELCNLKVLRNGRFKNLRTLRITNDDDYKDDIDIDIDSFNEIFKVTRSIRLLELQYEGSYEIDNEIPNIEYLKHLRFLRYEFRITQLPRSLTKLYHLQFIICSHLSSSFENGDFFPRDTNNLSNLRYVSYPYLNFYGIGKLKLLQKLEGFHVETKIGYRIEELKHMNDLCVLGIYQLENMSDSTEALNAKLCNKGKLTNLSLNWSYANYTQRDIVNCDLDERVFDKLQPHKYLKELNINNYMGVRSAVWMNEVNLIDNLEQIKLLNSLEWQILPPFGHLPFLKILRLENMPKVKRLDNKFSGNVKYCDFPSLEKLYISKLEALEDLFDAGVDSWFPCLTKLELYHCPNLQELPNLPPKLETLQIENIGLKTLNWCRISTVSLAHDKFCSLSNLERIELRSCLKCQILPPFGQLPFLKILRLENMPKVKRLDNDRYCDFPSLKELHIFNLEALEDWFDARVDYLFPCLTALWLYNCPNLQELPYLPPKLETLSIVNIGWKTLNCCSISKSIPLKELFVCCCQNIRFISMVGEIGTFAMLKKVKIENCPNSITFLGLSNQEMEITKNFQLIIDSLIISNSSMLQMDLLAKVTSVKVLTIQEEDELISFPFEAERCFLQVSSSIRHLKFESLQSLQSLPSSLTCFSSLEILEVRDLPQLQDLPDLPASLERLQMHNVESLQCLPSSLSTISSLEHLQLVRLPLLKSLPDLPTSVKKLALYHLKSLQCLPSSLSTISSLKHLNLSNIPLLKSLPELPPSLCELRLCRLDNLECLSSCLASLLSLTTLHINSLFLLRELPNLPPSLKELVITGCCSKLVKRGDQFRRKKR